MRSFCRLAVTITALVLNRTVHAQAATHATESFPVGRELPPRVLSVQVRDSLHPSVGVWHALLCVREFVPTKLNDWFITDDSGRLTMGNLPVPKLHVWIDAVGYTGRVVELDAEGARTTGTRIFLPPRRDDKRAQPNCPSASEWAALK